MSDSTKYFGMEIPFGSTPVLALVDMENSRESCTIPDAILGTVFPESCFEIGNLESGTLSASKFLTQLALCKIQ
jgi:hypothetical protein